MHLRRFDHACRRVVPRVNEDPEWGRMPATQIPVAVAVRDMAAGINDKEPRAQITSAADKVVAMNSQAVLRT
jgi:hypothetical protein